MTDDLFPVGYRFTLITGRVFTVVGYRQRTGGDGEPIGPEDCAVENPDGVRSLMSHGFIRSMGKPFEDDPAGG